MALSDSAPPVWRPVRQREAPARRLARALSVSPASRRSAPSPALAQDRDPAQLAMRMMAAAMERGRWPAPDWLQAHVRERRWEARARALSSPGRVVSASSPAPAVFPGLQPRQVGLTASP